MSGGSSGDSKYVDSKGRNLKDYLYSPDTIIYDDIFLAFQSGAIQKSG